MSVETLKQIVMKWVDAYNCHNASEAAALYDIGVTNVQLPWSKPVQGWEAMHTTFLRIFQSFPDIRVELENLVENGPWVVIEWRFSGTMRGEFAGHPPNGRPFTMQGM